MCDAERTYDFTADEQADVKATAIRRRDQAILFIEGFHPYLPGEVAGWNPLGYQLIGEATERAVSRWLKESEVECSRPPSMWAELNERLPDVATRPHGVSLDVKGSTSAKWYRFSEEQLQRARTHAVVWCGIKRGQPFDHDADFDSIPPVGATILGWSKLGDLHQAQVIDGWRCIRPATARCLRTLLTWIVSGVVPA